MAGFKKAQPEQAALKMALYGPPGSGKTLSTLLCLEGLAKLTGKRYAFVDTERGTDFYAQAVPERLVHPAAFDFDALYTRSVTEIDKAIRGLDPGKYCAVGIDSISHVWEATQAAYSGRTTKVGTIPFQAWGKIKKPYKDLMSFLLSSPLHVFILGRQANDFAEDEETEELKKVGVKMQAERDTAYEPHILIHMESVKQKRGLAVITAFAEKDRSGILAGSTIQWPDYNSLVVPLLSLFGTKQAQSEDLDAVANRDAEAISGADKEREQAGQEIMEKLMARIALCEDLDQLKTLGKENITAEVKKKMLPQQVAQLRDRYLEVEAKFK